MLILKVGGGAAINDGGVACDLAGFAGRAIVVHGAHALRDELAGRLGIEVRRVTSASGVESVVSDDELLDVLAMSYAGLRNTQLVAALQQHGVDAVGLSGLDGRAVVARRNPGIRVVEDGRKRLVRDRSGKPRSVNRKLLDLLLYGGFVPVLTVPFADEDGRAVNSENDDLVALLRTEYGAETVVQLIEAPGLLDREGDPGSLVPLVGRDELRRRRRQARGRFGRKLLAIERLLEQGADRVIMADGRTEHPLAGALAGGGTTFR